MKRVDQRYFNLAFDILISAMLILAVSFFVLGVVRAGRVSIEQETVPTETPPVYWSEVR